MSVLFEMKGITYGVQHKRGWFGSWRQSILDAVSLHVNHNERVGLVGASGSGKSTLAQIAVLLKTQEEGEVLLEGSRYHSSMKHRELLPYRKKVQMVFQDGGLNPMHRVEDIVSEGMWIHRLVEGKEEAQKKTLQLMEEVGLERGHMGRFPHQLSGGQRQRVAIARSLAVAPELLIADEPTSALDASVRAQVLNLFLDLQTRRSFSLLMITHDQAVVESFCERVLVLEKGRLR